MSNFVSENHVKLRWTFWRLWRCLLESLILEVRNQESFAQTFEFLLLVFDVYFQFTCILKLAIIVLLKGCRYFLGQFGFDHFRVSNFQAQKSWECLIEVVIQTCDRMIWLFIEWALLSAITLLRFFGSYDRIFTVALFTSSIWVALQLEVLLLLVVESLGIFCLRLVARIST